MGQDIERKLELEEPKVWVRMRRKLSGGMGKLFIGECLWKIMKISGKSRRSE